LGKLGLVIRKDGNLLMWNIIRKLGLVLRKMEISGDFLRHEGVWGSGCICPRFHHLGTRWMSVVSFTTRLLYPPPPGKEPTLPIEWEAGWAPGAVLTLPGFEPPLLSRIRQQIVLVNISVSAPLLWLICSMTNTMRNAGAFLRPPQLQAVNRG
jgi:hypothetical protein